MSLRKELVKLGPGTTDTNKFKPPIQLYQFHGDYTHPIRNKIAGIETTIVDPHNEVLPFWYKKDSKKPALLLHVDAHSDTCAEVPTIESLGEIDLMDYSKRLNIASFIAPAIFYEVIYNSYWINPRSNTIYALGGVDLENPELIHVPRLKTVDGKIRFATKDTFPVVMPMSYNDLTKSLKNYQGDIILDIDLDAFECLEDLNYNLRRKLPNKIGEHMGAHLRNRRIKKTFKLLKQLPRPNRITIARSQTPIASTPPETVSLLELKVYDEIEKIYSNPA